MECHAFGVRQPTFGLSAAGSRSEGGFNGPGEPENQWSAWERAGKVPHGRRPGTVWSDPEGVLDTASEAGATTLALSVEWARIEPEPGRLDHEALDGYARIFESAVARGVTPIGVLHDIAHPVWLGEEFWLTPGSPDRFADHVARVVGRLAPTCRHWVTSREPNLVALAGWVDGRHPPRRAGALSDAWAVVDNLVSSHILSYVAVHEVQPDAEVFFGMRLSSSYDWHRLMLDVLCAPALGVERAALDAWVDERRADHDAAVPPSDLLDLVWRRLAAATAPFGTGRFGRRSPRRAVDLAYELAERSSTAPASNGASPQGRRPYPLDALLVCCVPPPATAARSGAARSLRPWEVRPDPEALASWCRAQARAIPGLPLWIEDGFATDRGAPRTDGWDRPSYVRAQLRALGTVHSDAEEDATVAGYLYYSPSGDADPTWPAADFGLGPDAASLRRSVEEARPVR